MKQLPPGWTAGTLGDFVQPVRVGTDPASVPDLPYLGLEHVQAQTTNILGSAFASSVRSTSYEFEPGATLFARLRPYLNKVCTPTFRGIASGEFIIFPACAHLAPSFLKYLLNQPAFVEFTSTLDAGDRPRVNWSGIQNFPCALPPIAEQEEIVAVIEEQFSRLDMANLVLLDACSRLSQLRSSGLSQLLEIPGPQVHLGDIASVGSGATPKRDRAAYWTQGTVPWVTSGQLTEPFVYQPAAFITELALRETSVKLWPKHTLLVAMYGEGKTRGHCSELMIEATTNQACAAIIVDDNRIDRAYLKLLFAASYEANRRLASGGVQPNLSLGLIKTLEFPLPSLREQGRIVAKVERQLAIVSDLATVINQALTRSASLRRSILARAFDGRLRPKSSAEESASVLRKRVVETTSFTDKGSAASRGQHRRKVTS